MDLQKLKTILEKKLSKCELEKREEIAKAIARENPEIEMSKKMAIATSAAKKACNEARIDVRQSQRKNLNAAYKAYLRQIKESDETEDLLEVSNYDKIVVYYRSMGMDPARLKGHVGRQIRNMIKVSPAYRAWVKAHYESVEYDYAENDYGELLESSFREESANLLSLGFLSRRNIRPHNKSRGASHEVFYLPGIEEHPENRIAVPRNSSINPNVVRQIRKTAEKLLTARQLKNKLTEIEENCYASNKKYENDCKSKVADKIMNAKKRADKNIKFYYNQQDFKRDDTDFDPNLLAQGDK